MKRLVLVFKKIESKDETKSDNFYSSSKTEIIINESDIDYAFQSIYTVKVNKHTKLFRKRFRLDY